MKNNLISILCHDFSNPLTIIQSSAELIELICDRSNIEDCKEYFTKIKRAVKAMNIMIDGLMTLNKTEINKISFSRQEIDIAAFCANLIDEVKFSNKKPGEITLQITNVSILKAVTDEQALRHILINLLSNAVKFSPKNYSVVLDVRVTEKMMTFKIKDNGIGIKEEDIANLFNAFYRAKNSAKIPGSGLGLSIAKKFIEMLGGTIDVKSAPGEGTTFFVSIPMQAVNS